MAYVYRHIRLDKNIPFYIGIGNDNTYCRANDKSGRNKYWNNITKKTQYDVEIIMEGISWELACKKEIEFIALYGRKNDGGVLANLTKGGDGKLGVRPTNAYPKGHIPFTKGKPMPQYVMDKIRAATKGKPSWNKGIPQAKETTEKYKQKMREIGAWKSGKEHQMYGTNMPDWIKEKLRIANIGRPPANKGKTKFEYNYVNGQIKRRIAICQYNLDGTYVNEFESINNASERTSISKGCISLCVKEKRSQAGGYMWKTKSTLL